MNSATLVQKLWNYCDILRDGGLSYGDYPDRVRDKLESLAIVHD